jgi:hypothetical protein
MKFFEATILYRKSWQADTQLTFPPGPPLRYSHHRAQVSVRPTTPIHRLWFTVPENFFRPKIHYSDNICPCVKSPHIALTGLDLPENPRTRREDRKGHQVY